MKINLLGTRGSHPISNQESVYYGGSTPCIQVSSGQHQIILDAGTGIVNLRSSRSEKKEHHILLTHLHMDHIQGLGFFEPLFDSESEVHIWGPVSSQDSLFDRLQRFLSPPLFPLSLRDVPCDLHVHELADEKFTLQGFTIFTRFISHPGPTIGFRIQNGEKSMAYIPDHEPMIGSLDIYADANWLSGYDLCNNCDLLIHDAQYSTEKYLKRVGWGHSSIKHAAELAKACGAKHLVLFHHDPSHTDEMLNSLFEKFIDGNDYTFPIELAREGMEIDL
ncbi:MAG: MBL fold metallo-hydrolase [Saprospiraceae bacterium]|nr:MBL fold metallo-hydrolase [Saprospiraceae bacterium]